jgi:hypothetical protein
MDSKNLHNRKNPDIKLNQSEQNNNLKIININEFESSQFKTKKKSFISDINPHMLRRNIQKEQYIWFGVYDELLRNKLLINQLKKCRDSSLPLECAAIHLEKYQICFSRCDDDQVKAFLIDNDNFVVFLKLYLISKEQFVDLLKVYYKLNESNSKESISPNVLLQLFKEKDFGKVGSDCHLYNPVDPTTICYNTIKCLGELDNILIYSVTTDKFIKTNLISGPDVNYLRNVYLGLKKSFSPYSEYLLMYYVYRIEGVRNFYSISQLKECFFKLKNNNQSSDSKISAGSNSSGNFYAINNQISNNLLSNENNLQFYQYDTNNQDSNSPNKKTFDNETVKCSTCNASPFVSTPEKDHLNQYSYIFDLHHLPVFDENTGEFFWSNNEANWKKARDSILKAEETAMMNGKSVSINHKSLMSMSGSFMCNATNNNLNTHNNINTITANENKQTEEDINAWEKFKTDENSRTFVEELNYLLIDLEK